MSVPRPGGRLDNVLGITSEMLQIGQACGGRSGSREANDFMGSVENVHAPNADHGVVTVTS